MSTKHKINVCMDGSTKVVGIAWYGAINTAEIENSIKKVFNLPKETRIVLRDRDGDIIVITDATPLSEIYTVISS